MIRRQIHTKRLVDYKSTGANLMSIVPSSFTMTSADRENNSLAAAGRNTQTKKKPCFKLSITS